MTGKLDMNHQRIYNVGDPIGPFDAVSLYYTDTRYLNVNGTYPMKNNIKMDNNKIT